MTDYYVYYKIDPAHAAATRGAALALLDAVAVSSGVHGRLMRRADDARTWMEVYERVADPPAFEQALEVAVAKSGLLERLPPPAKRVLERFVALD